ncbi:hypothetical protein C0991_010727 [Blastosporella zonata]|nr:hypothetical protein C0991_010727 [Blastosporella zonata]
MRTNLIVTIDGMKKLHQVNDVLAQPFDALFLGVEFEYTDNGWDMPSFAAMTTLNESSTNDETFSSTFTRVFMGLSDDRSAMFRYLPIWVVVHDAR